MITTLAFQVQYLRQQSTQRMIEALTLFVGALFITALLPSLLVRYVYAGQPLLEQPPLLDVIPVVSFIIAVFYFIFAVAGNIMREMKIRGLEAQLMSEARTMPASASVDDLQAAMIKVERTSAKTTRGRKSSRK